MKKLMVSVFAALTAGMITQQAHAGTEPYCREFTQTVSVGNRLESGYGTACLQPDGAWQIISSSNYMAGQPVIMQRVVERPVIVERPYYSRRPVYVPESRIVFNFPLWVGGRDYHHHRHYDRHDWRHDRHVQWRGKDRHWKHGNGHGHGHRHRH